MSVLVDGNEFGLEDECRVGGDNTADGAVAIRKMRGNCQLALLADLHAQKTLVPALDNLALTNLERERVTAVIAGIELSAVGERAVVVNPDVVACGETQLVSPRFQVFSSETSQPKLWSTFRCGLPALVSRSPWPAVRTSIWSPSS